MLQYAFMLHFKQMVDRKIAAMTEEDWKALEEEVCINEEFDAHSPSLCVVQGPKEIRYRATIVAGPMGFHGSVSKVYLGPRHDTIEHALSDAVDAAHLTEIGGTTGLLHAYQSIR
jgi:hypothetical protein